MTHVRSTPSTAGRSRQHQYECKRCIVLYLEVEASRERAPERARELDRQRIHTLH
jgi:hypothetical protein